jgi:hypothetical protein
MAPTVSASGAELSAPGTLREKFPNEALAYARVPGPFAALMAQQGPGVGSPIADARITEALATIRGTFLARVEAMPPELREPISSLLLGHLRSPVEAIAMLSTETKRPQPVGLITMTLDLTTFEAVNQLIRELGSTSPSLSYLVQTGPGQPGVISFGGAAVGVVFEPSTRLLSLVVSPALSLDLVSAMVTLPPNPDHPMRAAEARIDNTGQGLFVWADVQRAMPFLQLGIEPAVLLELERWGLLKASAIALGAGATDANGKVRLQLDVPRTGLLSLLPVAAQDITIKTRGEPGIALAVNGVHADTTTRIEQLIGTFGTRDDAREFRTGIAELALTAGFSIDDVMAALGPQLVGFMDDTGEYLAVTIRNRQRLQTLLKAASALPHVTWNTRKSGNATIHHLRQTLPTEPHDNPYMSMLEAAGMVQLFWVEENDYLVFAALPQMLRDRYALTPKFALGSWLERNAGSSVKTAALLASTRFDGIPRFLYTQYLGGIYALAAMTDANIDLFELPSAAELGLPLDGALALSVHMGPQQLALEVGFDVSPQDGALAAPRSDPIADADERAVVAISAYQDDAIRARVQQAVMMGNPARTAAGIACSERSLRAGLSNAGLNLPAPEGIQGSHVRAVEVQVTSPHRVNVEIALRDLGSSIEGGQTIVFEGRCTSAGIRWGISGSLPEKYFPTQ